MTTTYAHTVDYSALVASQTVLQTAEAVRARGIKVEIVNSGAEALAKIGELIPAGATLMSGASKTLQHIGFEDQLISKNHPWVNTKDEILAETDPAKQMQLRAKSIFSPYYLGSPQAIVETGELVFASASGSQLSPYAFSSQNIIWVAGTQKIVPTLESALKRIREYAVPIENERARAAYGMDTVLAKILIFEQEPAKMGRNVNLILVNEAVGV